MKILLNGNPSLEAVFADIEVNALRKAFREARNDPGVPELDPGVNGDPPLNRRTHPTRPRHPTLDTAAILRRCLDPGCRAWEYKSWKPYRIVLIESEEGGGVGCPDSSCHGLPARCCIEAIF